MSDRKAELHHDPLRYARELNERRSEIIKHFNYIEEKLKENKKYFEAYTKFRELFLSKVIVAFDLAEPDRPKDTVELVSNYFVSASALSAVYHFSGLKRERDIITNSCCINIGKMGYDDREIIVAFLNYERTWRNAFYKLGIYPNWLVSLMWLFFYFILFFFLSYSS